MKRIVCTAAILIGTTVGVTACGFVEPQETQYIKDVTDGTNADVGPIDVRNAVLISDNGETGSLSMTLLNGSSSAKTVRFQYDTTDGRVAQSVSLAPNSILFRGTKPGDEQMILSQLNVKPGALISIFVDDGQHTGKMLRIPILTGSLKEYSTLLPRPTGTDPSEPGDAPTPVY